MIDGDRCGGSTPPGTPLPGGRAACGFSTSPTSSPSAPASGWARPIGRWAGAPPPRRGGGGPGPPGAPARHPRPGRRLGAGRGPLGGGRAPGHRPGRGRRLDGLATQRQPRGRSLYARLSRPRGPPAIRLRRRAPADRRAGRCGTSAGRTLPLPAVRSDADDARLDHRHHRWRRPAVPALERIGFTDSEIVRPEDGGLAIIAAATPEAGNWLPLPASGRFQFRLRLYDTPISSQTGETRAANLPRITRLDCR